jgi:hypothetical protein
MGSLDITSLLDYGWPVILLFVLTYGGRRLWNDVWPWLTKVYWPEREARWCQVFENQRQRDKEFHDILITHEATIREFQNGLRGEHRKITEVLEELVRQVRQLELAAILSHPAEEDNRNEN